MMLRLVKPHWGGGLASRFLSLGPCLVEILPLGPCLGGTPLGESLVAGCQVPLVLEKEAVGKWAVSPWLDGLRGTFSRRVRGAS